MPTYIYETITTDPEQQPRRFEVVQRMTEQALVTDSETGLKVKRIITGGIGIRGNVLRRSTVVNKLSPAATACGCSTGRPHRHQGGHKHNAGCRH